MSYQVLARKLRPGQFSELVGQDHVVRALTHALDHDRLHHAYLFTGTRGVGKTTIARILAKSLNCETGVSATPCGQCAVCQAVSENRFVDLIEVDAASRTGVDDTRELLDNAQYLPTQGRYKVYLIDEVHMLSASSFNALLKTLEEPPPHVKFLLATTDPKKVPVTVLSRCLQFQLKNLSSERIAEYLARVLTDEAIAAEPGALQLLAEAARGSMRDALSLTDQAIAFCAGSLDTAAVTEMLGTVGASEVDTLVAALAAQDAERLLAVTAELANRALDLESVLQALLGRFHQMAVAGAIGNGEGLPFDPETVQLYYQIALTGHRDLQWTPEPRVGLEMTLLRMLAFTPEPPPEGGRRVTAATAATAAGGRSGSAAAGPPAPGSGTTATVVPLTRPDGRAPMGPRASVTLVGEAAADRGTLQPSQVLEITDDSEAWAEQVAALGLSGVTRMIAEHAVRIPAPPGQVLLHLDPAHDTLLGERHLAALEAALGAAAGAPVTLQIEIQESPLETPAVRAERLRIERQKAAEARLQGDQTVQRLLSEFDGELVGVRPLDDPRQVS